jgi:spermidine/putrescine ABC transporter ATP-binding subunit
VYKLELENLNKSFGKTIALEDFALNIKTGEFVSFLGPSGCGKTTALRVIAGLVKPDRGTVRMNGEDVTDVPPRLRKLGMVFQNYALFPHMNVFENLAFGLRVEKMDGATIRKKVEEALATVKLSGLEERFPQQISGGQQQRVALARALVKNPEILLMDEPLSNLDAKLRQQMRNEIRLIQRKLDITAIFVTHDQEEAISMSDRVVIMRQGRIVQVGTPIEIYEEPRDIFVADFIGKTNILEGGIETGSGGQLSLRLSPRVALPIGPEFAGSEGQKLTFSVRPDRIALLEGSASGPEGLIPAKVLSRTFLGPLSSYTLLAGEDLSLNVIQQNTRGGHVLEEGEACALRLDPKDLVLVHEK